MSDYQEGLERSQIRRVCLYLHESGVETTPDAVYTWVYEMHQRSLRCNRVLSCIAICEMILSGESSMISLLHMRFGDAIL